ANRDADDHNDCVAHHHTSLSRVNVRRALTRRRTACQAAAPTNSSTSEQIGPGQLVARDRSPSRLETSIRMPSPGIRWCDSWHPLSGLRCPPDKIFEVRRTKKRFFPFPLRAKNFNRPWNNLAGA